MNPVKMYTTQVCPFCLRAKALLKQRGVEQIEEIRIDLDPAARDHAVSSMKAQIGRSAKYIGGQSIQLHGGMGMTEEYSIGHYFRRLCMIENAFGATAVHLERMALLDTSDFSQKAA